MECERNPRTPKPAAIYNDLSRKGIKRYHPSGHCWALGGQCAFRCVGVQSTSALLRFRTGILCSDFATSSFDFALRPQHGYPRATPPRRLPVERFLTAKTAKATLRATENLSSKVHTRVPHTSCSRSHTRSLLVCAGLAWQKMVARTVVVAPSLLRF